AGGEGRRGGRNRWFRPPGGGGGGRGRGGRGGSGVRERRRPKNRPPSAVCTRRWAGRGARSHSRSAVTRYRPRMWSPAPDVSLGRARPPLRRQPRVGEFVTRASSTDERRRVGPRTVAG